MSVPQPERPNMPAYGIAETGEGLLSWNWVEAEMAKSRNYWICSVKPDGLPHASPVWGVWHEGALYFGCARSSRKGRNMLAQPQVSVHLESGDDVVILEGRVEQITDTVRLRPLVAVYAAKYPGYTPNVDTDPDTLWFTLHIQRAFAWKEYDFPKTATRWTFNESASV